MMKLTWSSRSPFVRKVMVLAHETNLLSQLDCSRVSVAMTKPNRELMRHNPLSKIPTLILEDGSALYDSAVICEYLDTLHDGPKMFPDERGARFLSLRRQALGDGLMDHLLLWRNERERPMEQISQVFIAAYREKAEAILDRYEEELVDIEQTPFNIGHITYAISIGYIDFRFPDFPWRQGRQRLAEWYAVIASRPSMRATDPMDERV
jgi:glutathione S-transferase